MSKFKVGDKVRVRVYLKHPSAWDLERKMDSFMGKTVTIASVSGNPFYPYHIAEDARWYWREEDFEPIEPREFIVIRRDKRDVIASHKRGDEIVKTAKATCASSDEFNFETGAKLAFDRLVGREEPKAAPKFKVGDRVKTEYDVGTIVEIQHDELPFLVLHDTWNEGHNAKAFAPHLRLTGERSEWFEEKEIILIPNESPAPEPKYYTGRVVCISGEYGIGKIYTVVNGRFTDKTMNIALPYKSVEHMNDTFLFGKVAEVKE